MPRRSQPGDPESVRSRLVALLVELEAGLRSSELRERVLSTVPIAHAMRDLGASLMPLEGRPSGRARVLAYLRRHVGEVIHGDELMVVAGINDYPRRIRELGKEDGWPIMSGVAAAEIRSDAEEAGEDPDDSDLPTMQMDDYLLVDDERDEEAASRWKLANTIRNSPEGVKAKVLRLLRSSVGQRVTSEELRYVANDRSEWARRTRELRTEEGWPVVTRQSGDPTLPVGVYVLAQDVQAPKHDRHIPELVRREVMERDSWSCQWAGCGWNIERRAHDPRFLEAHHIHQHAEGGTNTVENLITLCNLHHDEVHRTGQMKT